MKKIFKVALSAIFLSGSSCDKNCEDCGPGVSRSILIENKSSNGAVLGFYRDGNETSIEIDTGQLTEIAFWSPPPGGITGLLSHDLQQYDSVQVLLPGLGQTTFLPNECSNTKNPLCKNNYTVIKDEVDRKGNRTFVSKFTLED